MIDGVINVYKEAGYTSFDVVAKLRGILKQKKIGHTGTLDPMAEGVLMVCLGKATKLVDMITSGTKEYEAHMKLGITTDTEDITGKILTRCPVSDDITNEAVLSVIESYVGKYMQIPPMYSAIKKDGKKLYEYAREGVNIEREPRAVEIFSIKDIKVNLPYISFLVHCSKGTYIRSLCRDIGEKLGCGGTLTKLTRSQVHGYLLKDSLKLSDIERLRDEGRLNEYVLPMDVMLKQYPAYEVRDDFSKLLLNGNKLFMNQIIKLYDGDNSDNTAELSDNLIRVYYQGNFVALYEPDMQDNILKPYKMFL